jgi:hypothetical protein
MAPRRVSKGRNDLTRRTSTKMHSRRRAMRHRIMKHCTQQRAVATRLAVHPTLSDVLCWPWMPLLQIGFAPAPWLCRVIVSNLLSTSHRTQPPHCASGKYCTARQGGRFKEAPNTNMEIAMRIALARRASNVHDRERERVGLSLLCLRVLVKADRQDLQPRRAVCAHTLTICELWLRLPGELVWPLR